MSGKGAIFVPRKFQGGGSPKPEADMVARREKIRLRERDALRQEFTLILTAEGFAREDHPCARF